MARTNQRCGNGSIDVTVTAGIEGISQWNEDDLLSGLSIIPSLDLLQSLKVNIDTTEDKRKEYVRSISLAEASYPRSHIQHACCWHSRQSRGWKRVHCWGVIKRSCVMFFKRNTALQIQFEDFKIHSLPRTWVSNTLQLNLKSEELSSCSVYHMWTQMNNTQPTSSPAVQALMAAAEMSPKGAPAASKTRGWISRWMCLYCYLNCIKSSIK